MVETKVPLKVFLCHAHSDKDAVKSLYARLVKDGVDAWLDKEKLLPGQSWRTEIQKAVRGADVVVICLSKEFNQAGFRQREVKWALDTAMEKPAGEIFVIPARLEECEVLDSLSEWHWVDLFDNDGYDMLTRALRARANSIGTTLQAKRSWMPRISSSHVKADKPVEEDEHVVSTANEPPVKKTEIDTKVETPKTPPKTTGKPFKLKTEYMVAILGAIATIIAAIIGSPLIERMFSQVPEPDVSMTNQVQVSSTKQIVETIAPTFTPTKAFTPSQTAFPSEITDSKGVEMVLVPEGEFTMGSNDGDNDEQPVHQVYLETYHIDKYEVTNASYKTCVDAGVCDEPTNASEYNNSKYDQHPVVYVSWKMANEYCDWRGAKLPTEAEWEKAARGMDGRTYPWGNEFDGNNANFCDSSCSYAWADKNSDDGYATTSPVGSYLYGVSPYGAYDMAGNVWEWVADWYYGDYYSSSPEANPIGPESGDNRVMRGSAWNLSDDSLRSPNRNVYNPANAYFNIGFRCSRSLP